MYRYGQVRTHGNERVLGVVTRDSLDGTTAVLSHHVTKMRDTHPMLDRKEIDNFLFSSASDEVGLYNESAWFQPLNL